MTKQKKFMKRIPLRIDKTTYQRLLHLKHSQHESFNRVITDLINSNYRPIHRAPMNDQTRNSIFKVFLAIENLVGQVYSDISHSANNINQIAFKINVNDFHNKNIKYIKEHADNFTKSIMDANVVFWRSTPQFKKIRKELQKIWQLLE